MGRSAKAFIGFGIPVGKVTGDIRETIVLKEKDISFIPCGSIDDNIYALCAKDTVQRFDWENFGNLAIYNMQKFQTTIFTLASRLKEVARKYRLTWGTLYDARWLVGCYYS